VLLHGAEDLCGLQPRSQENWHWTPIRRKKMGRPIKKSKMRESFSPGASGTIEVTAYYPSGGSLQQNDNSYVVSQRGSKQFKIHQANDSSEAVYTLVAKAPASLVAGEMCIKVILDDSTLAYVEKFYNNTIHYVESDGTTTGTIPYTLSTDANEDTVQSGKGVVDSL
jgi:hypothetical protein